MSIKYFKKKCKICGCETISPRWNKVYCDKCIKERVKQKDRIRNRKRRKTNEYKNYYKQYKKGYYIKNKDKFRDWAKKSLSNRTPEQILRDNKYTKKYNYQYCHQKGNCIKCNNEFIGTKKRKYCNECRSQLMKGNQYYKLVKNRLCGKDSPNWKDGITHWRKRIYDSLKYKNWRKEIFKRDNHICQECGKKSGNGKTVRLEAHHLISFAQLLRDYKITSREKADICSELWKLSLGTTLCYECHQKTKKGRPKN